MRKPPKAPIKKQLPVDFELGDPTSSLEWQDIVSWVDDLPPLPHVASQVIMLLEDPKSSATKLAQLLGSDPALATRVLRIANSAMFGRQREITTIKNAITTVGFLALKGLIVASTLRQMNRRQELVDKAIWENSLCTALGAYKICEHLRKPYLDEVFLLGLLHDIGKIVLYNHEHDLYQKVIADTKNGKEYYEAEQEVYGFSHALIGGLVAKKWHFSPLLCQVILHHHEEITPPLLTVQNELIVFVQTANYISHHLGYGHFEGYPELTSYMYQSAAKLNLDEAETDALVSQINEIYIDHQSVFEL
jgi:HD-like signal output (HDOD) protein